MLIAALSSSLFFVRRYPRFLVMALGGGLLVSQMGGCSGNSDAAAITAAKLSEGCLINSDCDGKLVCAFRRCHVECADSKDCDPGQRCVAADRPVAVCQLEEEKSCTFNSQCPMGQLCAVDGQCRDQCKTDRDCLKGQACATGSCAEQSELTLGKLPEQLTAGSGTPCVYNSDCPIPLACVDGQCRVECRASIDCFPTFECRGCRCTPGFAAGAAGAAGAGSSEPLGCNQ